ncbi:MAG TPA: carboxypeptidase regulatory-like domain-containing protein [Terriglobales bacterium]|nr:carboxypeptidase regulatory-like domain-containing protein [Terriglobales bacterium]
MKSAGPVRLVVIAGCCGILFSLSALASDAIDIQTSHHSARELQEKVELEQLLKKLMPKRTAISRFARCSAVVFLLLQVAKGLPVCGFKDPIPLLHPRIQLRFNLEGKPLPGANVELYFGKPSATNDLPYETGVTGSDGITVTSELSVATFYIRVLSRDLQIAVFTLDAPLERELHANEGNVELLATPLAPVADSESCCDFCSAVVEKILQADLRALRGVVMDPTGAVVSKAKIDVYQNEEGKQAIAHLATDNAGRFTSELAPGKYLVIFKACGFDAQKVVVTVVPNGWRGIQVSLAIGNCKKPWPGNESNIATLHEDSPEDR